MSLGTQVPWKVDRCPAKIQGPIAIPRAGTCPSSGH